MSAYLHSIRRNHGALHVGLLMSIILRGSNLMAVLGQILEHSFPSYIRGWIEHRVHRSHDMAAHQWNSPHARQYSHIPEQAT